MIESVMYAAIAPLVLMLVTSVWRYPAVFEEVVKWGILRLTTDGKAIEVKQGAMVGLVFGLSETVLFSGNAWIGGDWGALGGRLLLTVPMHALTATVIAWFIQKRMGYVGVLIAMVIHAGFNYFISLR